MIAALNSNALTGNPLQDVIEPIEELCQGFNSSFVLDFGCGIGITQYVFWLIVIAVIVVCALTWACKKVKTVPDNKIGQLIEWGYDAVCRNMGEGGIGHGWKKHMPFIATLFFFILIANVIGLIPGVKTPTGSLSVTWALATISFFYFNYQGIKSHGGWAYIKSIAPSGLPAIMVPVIWFFEFFSLVIRWLTLAVRLYGNMFAGHMILGVFAILLQVFIVDAIHFANITIAMPALVWFLFLLAMYTLECLVAFLQAYVFAVLSSVYIGLATNKH